MALEAGRVYLDVEFEERQVAQALNGAVSTATRDAQRTLNRDMGRSAERVGRTLTRTLTPAAAAVGLGFRQAFNEWDAGVDAIRAGTGATGRDLAKLEGSMKRVANGGIGPVRAGLAEVGTILADLQTRTGATGAELETLTARMVQLNDVGNTATVETVTRTFGDWSIAVSDSEAALDQLFRTSQATGPTVDRLGQLMVQYGAPLRELGYGFDEAAILMGKWEQEGVNTELVMGSLRVALGKFARDQRDPQQALADTIDAIQGAGSAAEANAIAFETFGARAGTDMARAIQEGRFDIDELVDTLSSSGESIQAVAEDTSNLGDRLRTLGNRAMGIAGPVGEIGMAVAGLAAAAGPAATGIGKIMQAGRPAGAAIGGIAAALGTGGLLGVAGAATAAVIAFGEASGRARQHATDFAEAIRADNEALGEATTSYILNEVAASHAAEAAEAFGISTEDLLHAVRNQGEGLEWLNDYLADTTTLYTDAAGQEIQFNTAAQHLLETVGNLSGRYDEAIGLLNEQNELTAEAERIAREEADAKEAAREAYADYARSLRNVSAEQEALNAITALSADHTDTLAQAVLGFVDPMAAWQTAVGLAREEARAWAEGEVAAGRMAADAVQGFVDEAIPTFDQWRQALVDQVTAQEEWAENMAALAGRVSNDTLAELGRMGPEAAPLIAELTEVSDTELAEVEDLFARRAETAGDEFIAQLIRAQGAAAAAAADLGTGAADGLVDGMASGLPRAARAASGYINSLVDVTNPLLLGLGEPAIAHVTGGPGGIPEFAFGGQVPGGYGVRDDVLAALTRGEVVESVPAVRHWGAGPLLDLNNRQVPDGWYIPGHSGPPLPGFNQGGIVDERDVPRPPTFLPFRPPVSTPAHAISQRAYDETVRWVQDNAGVGRGLAWARSQEGRPYIWGGVGPAGYDCSGFLSAVTNIILGRNPHSRLFTTATIGGSPYFRAGGDGQFVIGNRIGNPGHMAGSIGGVNIESAGGVGVRVGPEARGSSYGTHRYSFAGFNAGGLVDPRALLPHGEGDAPFDLLHPQGRRYLGDRTIANLYTPGGLLNPHIRDAGGPLLPGYTYNGTGANETVVAGRPDLHGRGRIEEILTAGLTGGMGLQEAIAALDRLVAGWDAAAAAAAEAARRADLVVQVSSEQADLDRLLAEEAEATGEDRERLTEQRIEQEQRVADAIDALAEHDAQARADRLDGMAAEAAAMLQAEQDALAAHQQAVADMLSQAQAAYDDAQGRLQRLLDERERLLDRMAAAEEAYAVRVADAEDRLADQMAALARRRDGQRLDAMNRAIAAEQQLVDARRAALDAQVQLTSRTEQEWAWSAASLTANANAQTEMVTKWREGLAALRDRGVGQDLIAELGLDTGPRALRQVTRLMGESDEALSELSAAYAAQTVAITATVTAEQAQQGSALARQIAQVQTDLSSQLTEIGREYSQQAGELAQAHTATLEELAAAQTDLMTELGQEMAQLGQEQGRTTAEAIADGLLSGIPAIEEAVQAVLDAQGRLTGLRVSVGPADGGPLSRVDLTRFDNGGEVPPGVHRIVNATGDSEWMFRSDQIGALLDAAVDRAPGSTEVALLERIARAIEDGQTITLDGDVVYRGVRTRMQGDRRVNRVRTGR